MILYNEKKYSDYIDLLYNLIRLHDEEVNVKLFPNYYYFYCREALQNRFKRKFTLKQVKQLIKEELALKTITLKHQEASQS